MNNMLTYARETFTSFEEAPLNEIDSLIFSWLSYLHFPAGFSSLTGLRGMALRDLFCSEYFQEMLINVKSPEDTILLLAACSASPRYRNIRIFGYEQELSATEDIQFAAVTFEVFPKLYYIAFRGTDSTMIGWKEDLSLALEAPIPSQSRALNYFSRMADRISGSFILGGHSKGGNLAVYAAARCGDEQCSRITQIYTHDGPGFLAEELEYPGFSRVRSRIRKTLPQSSFIGMTFEQECDFKIIRSNEKSVAQHNPFSWEVENGAFCEMTELTGDARVLYRAVNSWVNSMNQDERETFIREVFDILEEPGEETFDALGANFLQSMPAIIRKTAELDKDTRHFLLKQIREFAKSSVRSIPDVLHETLTDTKGESKG